MNATPPDWRLLDDELQAVLSSLKRAREPLSEDNGVEADELWRRLDACAHHIAALDPGERDRIRPALLAVLDELQRTIDAFEKERRNLGDRVKSAHRNMVAGAAYRQTKSR